MLCNANPPKDFLQRSILVLCWNSHTIPMVASQRFSILARTLELLSRQNPNISGTILKNETLTTQVNIFPKVKTPAAYVHVRCYPPARFSKWLKDFLAGAYH